MKKKNISLEVATVEAMKQVLRLDDRVVDKLLGTKNAKGEWNRDGEMYRNFVISDYVGTKIAISFGGEEFDKAFYSKEGKIIDILSVIHDSWVKNNPDNFLKEGKNKEYQFTPLMLLDWKEAKSHLLFLKPILEEAEVEVDEAKIEAEFDIMQKEFLIKNGITSHQKLVSALRKGSRILSRFRWSKYPKWWRC